MPFMAVPVMRPGPVVATVHDVIPYVMPEYRSPRAQRVNLAVARQMVRKAAAIITPSVHAATDVAEIFDVPLDRIWVTHEAADERYFPLADPGQIQPVLDRFGLRGPYVFNIGGLDVRKNLPVLIRAFHHALPEIDAEVRLVIGGAAHSGNAVVFPPVEPLIRDLGLSDRIVMTGRIPEDAKVALMQGASLYVTPSLYEGFGLSALEAMACGVPLVASNRTSFPEIVGDGGLLVEPRVEPLAAAITSVLSDSILADGLRSRGLERARQFSWRKTAEETIAVYEHVLGRDN
jgi:glycosyltransferase involved in cell wall biosynthesis